MVQSLRNLIANVQVEQHPEPFLASQGQRPLIGQCCRRALSWHSRLHSLALCLAEERPVAKATALSSGLPASLGRAAAATAEPALGVVAESRRPGQRIRSPAGCAKLTDTREAKGTAGTSPSQSTRRASKGACWCSSSFVYVHVRQGESSREIQDPVRALERGLPSFGSASKTILARVGSADTNPSGYDGRDRQTLPPSATSLTPSAKGGKRRKSRTRNTAARARSGGLHLTRRRDITAGRAKKQDRQASGMYMEWGYP